jgi:hypothetical protein
MIRRFALAALVMLTAVAVAAPVDGSFALSGGTAKTRAFMLDGGSDPLTRSLTMWMTRPNGAAIVRYDVDMTKLLHLIVVSDDFRWFDHVHPAFGRDGRFRIVERFPRPALYHLYADAEPSGIGQQVFRFDLPVAGGTAAGARALAPPSPTAATGPYVVRLSATRVRAGRDIPLAVHVRERGAPARDLHPYLGALAHAVFLSATDLRYVHVHPMPAGGMNDMSFDDMPGMSMGSMEMKPLPETSAAAPDMVLHVRLPQPGRYALWLQFRGGDTLHVVRFTITAA